MQSPMRRVIASKVFTRPSNGIYSTPEILRLEGKSTVHEIQVAQADMPNFHIEAVTVSDGKIHTIVREIVVPPSKRVMNVEVLPSQDKYGPGDEAVIRVKLTGVDGKPVTGSAILSVYDKALEYISGGSNVANIRDFFWRWKRHHRPHRWDTIGSRFRNLVGSDEEAMKFLGMFGRSLASDKLSGAKGAVFGRMAGGGGGPLGSMSIVRGEEKKCRSSR